MPTPSGRRCGTFCLIFWTLRYRDVRQSSLRLRRQFAQMQSGSRCSKDPLMKYVHVLCPFNGLVPAVAETWMCKNEMAGGVRKLLEPASCTNIYLHKNLAILTFETSTTTGSANTFCTGAAVGWRTFEGKKLMLRTDLPQSQLGLWSAASPAAVRAAGDVHGERASSRFDLGGRLHQIQILHSHLPDMAGR